MKKLFDSQEKIYFGLLVFFVATMLIVFNFFQGFINSLHPLMQFLFMNIGVYLIITFLFKSIAVDKKVSFTSWEGGVGALLAILAIDVLLPEYHVLFDGQLISGGLFGMGATDYVLGFLGQTIGIHGMLNFFTIHVSWLWLWTYGLCVITLFMGAALMTKHLIKKI